jgi:peroxiredoxin
MLKSIYVSAYMMAAIVVTVFAVRELLASGDVIAWVGVILTSAPLVLVIGWLMVFRNVARTSARLPVLIVLGLVGVAATLWRFLQGGSQSALILAVASFLGYLAYAYWYSSFRHRHSRQIEAGRFLPDFELTDIEGYPIASRSLTETPVIWIFYRGNWCPLCMAQIKELVAQYHQLQALGIRVALISPQPHKFTTELAKKFDVAFHFLTDENNRAARVLGIASPHGLPMGMQVLGYDSETVMPTVIITESGGRILWAHETDNYRIRPEPETYMSVLREHQVVT